jgi:phosphatidate cytidylyltransferase
MIGTRVASAIVIAALLLVAVLWLPAAWSAAVLSLILLGAAWEWAAFIGIRTATRLLFLTALVALCMSWWYLSESRQGLRAVLWAAFGYWSLATAWLVAAPRTPGRTLIAGGGLLALSFAWVALARMRIDWHQGQYAVLYALLIVWFADSGAYFAGRKWGGAKLAPTISPGKTWAGLWGGLAVCALLAAGVAAWQELPLLPLLAVTLVACVYSVVGDLTESLAKRFAGVKDSGSLIPGHGGVLDRFDSLLAAAPILMLGVELLPVLRA